MRKRISDLPCGDNQARRKRDEVYVQGILNDPPLAGRAHAEIGLSRKCPESGQEGETMLMIV